MLGLTVALAHGQVVRQQDEGVEAHLFQLWLVAEVVLIGYFGIKWAPHSPRQAFTILVIQILLLLLGCFPVFYFNL